MTPEDKLNLMDNIILFIAIVTALLSFYYLLMDDTRIMLTSIVSICLFFFSWLNNISKRKN